ncbi:MAG TPA: endonuclease/exonuclease/phosphatase family protein [Candidatus Methanoperedens sp.]|nr:endonuclease/exonuclease/phosphatase family protein [Candidatus Methanoperedens sp.]
MRLRLLCWNIHKGIGGLDRRYRPERVVAVLEHYAPDLVLLQEVDDGASRSRHDRQAELFARALGLRHHAFFPNVRVRGGGSYGNAVLSRHPIAAARNLDLTFPAKKRRSALYAALHVHGEHGGRPRTVHVFNLHLGLSGFERKWQLARFFADHPFAGLGAQTPVVVGGDFNDVWGRLGRVFFEPAGFPVPERPARTFPAWAPVRALDAIYARGGLRVNHLFRSHLRAARFASDHLPLYAEIELL